MRKVWRKLASIRIFFWVAGLLLGAMVLGTLLPQWDLFHRLAFQALLVALAVNTVACVVLRWRAIPTASLVSHAGVLCILLGGALSLKMGVGGQLALHQGEGHESGLRQPDGQVDHWLPFEVRLKKFSVENYGPPIHALTLANRREGWSKVLEVQPGGTYHLASPRVELSVAEFNPDFSIDMATRRVTRRSDSPHNPALKVTVTASPTRSLWVFQNFPGMHQEGQDLQLEYQYRPPMVKQYRSDVEILDRKGKKLTEASLWVNHPLRFGGYTLYQASFDPDDPGLSILQARRDLGVPVVYAGFVTLLLGLSFALLRGKP